MAIGGVVLAAGSGSRMGTPKAELVVGGTRLLDRAAAALVAGGCAPVVAVVRDGVSSPVPSVLNPDPERGMRSSLELGLAALPSVDAFAVVLVDVPGLSADAVATVIRGWRPGRITVGVTTAGGTARRTHPTVMSPAMWRDAVLLAEPDEGARRFLHAHPELVDEVEVGIDPTDLDTPEDLAAWRE